MRLWGLKTNITDGISASGRVASLSKRYQCDVLPLFSKSVNMDGKASRSGSVDKDIPSLDIDLWGTAVSCRRILPYRIGYMITDPLGACCCGAGKGVGKTLVHPIVLCGDM